MNSCAECGEPIDDWTPNSGCDENGDKVFFCSPECRITNQLYQRFKAEGDIAKAIEVREKNRREKGY